METYAATTSRTSVINPDDRNQKWTNDNAYIIPDPKDFENNPNVQFTVVQPTKIKVPLMEHQKFAVNYCLSMESTTSFVPPGTDFTIITNKALYCDPVGAGKSLVMLCCFHHDSNLVYHQVPESW